MLSLHFAIACSLLLVCACTLSIPPQPSIGAAKGALLGIRYINYMLEVVTIDIPTGNMKVLDTKLNNSDGFLFGATSTTDDKGTYYVALMNSAGSQIFAVDATSGKTLSVHTLQGLYYMLGYDSKENVIYGVEENNQKLSTVYKIDTSSFSESKVGAFPANSIPYIMQSSYDKNAGIMYDMMLTNNSSPIYYGLSVTDGSIVAKAPIPEGATDPILFNLFSDEAKKGRLLAISQDRSPPNQFFLSEIEIKGNEASLSRVGTTTFATVDFYPTVAAISSDTRQFYALMTNSSAIPIYYDWFVIDIDSGDVVYHVKNWTLDAPVNLQYVTFA
eukprot:Phypoly_transcript_13164.p1 GENE.Phypoly_transcript_13164~~Phypoly_transcript_13164.p1  ORF type:complete len:330 (+),score=47.01 Phypoly_transcript_13164:40-1029(+)